MTQTIRKNINLVLYKHIGQIQWLNDLVRLCYGYILLPIIASYLKIKFKNIINIDARHSLLEKKNFNFLLSDIDLTIVIKNDSNPTNILKEFIKIKNVLIMFDLPEVYTQKEYASLARMQSSPYWGVIYTLWCIRKINWNYKSLNDDKSELNQIKKTRSIKISLSKILAVPLKDDQNYGLNDFLFLKKLNLSKQFNQKSLCYYSYFLETISSTSLNLIMSLDEFHAFNSFMPNEKAHDISLELKILITEYEILITQSSIRLDEAYGRDTKNKIDWITKLKSEKIN